MSRRRGGHGGGHGSSERWLLTYADMITLLLVFFIVLYAMSMTDAHKLYDLSKALSSAFHVTSGGSSGALPDASQNVLTGAGAAILPEQAAMIKVQDQLDKALAKDGDEAAKGISTKITQRGLVISLANSAFFDSGEATIRPGALGVLQIVAKTLKASGRAVMIEGHTDNTPIATFRFPSNWELSTARATAVVRYLITRCELSPARLSAAGYGEYYPLAPNNNPENRAKNRRVDIVILRSDLKGQRPAGQL